MAIQKPSRKWSLWLISALLFCIIPVFLVMCQGTPKRETSTIEDVYETEDVSELEEISDVTEIEIVYPNPSTAFEMIMGTGGHDYGEPVMNSMHTQFGVNCMNSCHMSPTMDWTDADADTYKLVSEDGADKVEVCNKCHPPVVKMGLDSFNASRFNRKAIGNYDGDDTVEGVQDEVQGLLDLTLKAIHDSGVKSLNQDPYWKNVTTEAQKMAIFNWDFVNNDKSLGVHNTARSVQLLQRSYEDLTGRPVPGADPYSPVPHPELHPSSIVFELVMEIEGARADNGEPLRATALPNVGTGSYVLIKGYGKEISEDNPATAVEWSLIPPEGSEATITRVDDEHVYFLADKMAWYEVKLTVTDSEGNTTEGTSRIHSAPYVGVGSVETAFAPKCASCHPADADSCAETAHARAFSQKIDGQKDRSGYDLNVDSLVIYTLGYNVDAPNGGFDDVAAKVGWAFPDPKPGNWDAMPLELQEKASVQCESCHGPGGRWVAASIVLSADGCGYCHDSDIRHNKYKQWSKSGHADTSARAFTFPFGEEHKACLKCHNTEAFIDHTAGKEGSLRRFAGRTGDQPVTCAICHDPHHAKHEKQLRVYDAVTLPDGTEISGVGASAVCMMCHNGRVTPDEVAKKEPHYPHYSTAAEMIAGTGGYDYGEALEDSTHKLIGIGCVDCHMDPSVEDEALAGHNEIGGHTYTMTSRDGEQNILACNGCHDGITGFNRAANGDYDGNRVTEGVQDEVQGLLDLVLEAIKASGVDTLDHYPYWKNVSTGLQKAAIYNWSFVSHDKSSGLHNTARSVQLLQRSYRELTNRDVPGADLR
jgi:hypothetical protein